MKLWLDDIRPAPLGWEWVMNIEDAKKYLASGKVTDASLDHDLGACAYCHLVNEVTWEGVMPHCTHVGTGWDLVLWMVTTGHWPTNQPKVHSMNPVGTARMKFQIAQHYV